MPVLRTNALMIHIIVPPSSAVVCRIKVHRACPLVKTTIFRTTIRLVIVAPATVHRVVEVLRHPSLRADYHRFVGLPFIGKGTVLNGR